MKLFALLATVYFADAPPDAYVIDHAMSGADCIQSMIELQPIMMQSVHLSCEFDHAADS